ncbi:glycosyltransferase [Enterocloster lavalensis]|uniref:glycosyltransferase n=1 Tax=Enterocloster lavalensis TaxID=460384 RepID=UPI0034A277CA
MNRRYSVLMSVYYKECPAYLQAAIESMLNQTEAPDEIVLVCDGPLTDEQNLVIGEYLDCLKVLRLECNKGLGTALAEGIKFCRNEWIARMDSDDISANNRCSLQMDYFEKHPEIDVLSGTIAEFEGEACTEEEVLGKVTSYKFLPESNGELKEYIYCRNPINHPCVMFRKSSVLEAGGYQACQFFEDYDLWMRMFKRGAVFANVPNVLLYMRINHMYERRGGLKYAKAIIMFYKKMYTYKLITMSQFLTAVGIRVTISLIPAKARQYLYETGLRKH